jgi:hypothetical protein
METTKQTTDRYFAKKIAMVKKQRNVIMAIVIIAGVALLASCKKDSKPIVAGNYYNYKIGRSDKNWHPVNPVFVKDIYYNEAEGMNYCHCLARYYGWPNIAAGVAFNPAPDSVLVWNIPIDDLK